MRLQYLVYGPVQKVHHIIKGSAQKDKNDQNRQKKEEYVHGIEAIPVILVRDIPVHRQKVGVGYVITGFFYDIPACVQICSKGCKERHVIFIQGTGDKQTVRVGNPVFFRCGSTHKGAYGDISHVNTGARLLIPLDQIIKGSQLAPVIVMRNHIGKHIFIKIFLYICQIIFR